MIEECDYTVEITLQVAVGFSPIERETPITESDAISNALGMVQDSVWDDLASEGFSIIATTAERI